jgi:hypothetical protein
MEIGKWQPLRALARWRVELSQAIHKIAPDTDLGMFIFQPVAERGRIARLGRSERRR